MQEANAAFDPEELVCPGCQPHSVDNCPTHGMDWLAFKCRYVDMSILIISATVLGLLR